MTATEVRVALVEPTPGTEATIRALTDFFNSHFQMYGRRIRVVPVSSQGSGESSQRATADAVATQAHPFAAAGYGGQQNLSTYLNELARHHVVSVTTGVLFRTNSDQQRHAPYEWSFEPPFDSLEANLAEFVCKDLVGLPAKYGGSDVSGKPRKFAALFHAGETLPDLSLLTNRLAACHAPPLKVIQISHAFEVATDSAAEAQFVQLRNENYTTLLNFGGGLADFAPYANGANYHPEWLDTGVLEHFKDPYEAGSTGTAPNQLTHLFGVATWNRILPLSQQPYYEAASAEGDHPAANDNASSSMDLYHSLLVLASGIQTAGPNLTATSFEHGLQRARFANPGAGGPQLWQGSVGFPAHSMMQDFGLVWYSSTATDYYIKSSTPGGWCYVGRGRRWSEGRWPDRDPGLFDPRQGCQ